MLRAYIPDPARRALVERTVAASHVDGFIAEMVEAGYQRITIQDYLRAAAHLSDWLHHSGRFLIDLDVKTIESFRQHLVSCDCTGFERNTQHHAAGAKRFLQHLQKICVVPAPAPSASQPLLYTQFCHWMQQHRGAQPATLDTYGRIILDALRTLGEDPQKLTAPVLRSFVLDRANPHGRSKAKLVMTSLRTFVRYLIAQGHCAVGLDAAIPTIAGWRLATLPDHLPAADVERILVACDVTTAIGARDRAVLLLLCRLGLRASDVCQLKLQDIDWTEATVQVMGKSHRAVQLPLPQEVGDAVLQYLTIGRPTGRSDRLFLRMRPPVGTPLARSGVSCIVTRAIERAGVRAPAHGAHLLRNCAATSLLAQGASLQSIATLLRHRSLDTTTLYAKVDFKLLRQLARPWPEVSPC